MQDNQNSNYDQSNMNNTVEEQQYDAPWHLPIGPQFTPVSFMRQMVSKTADRISSFKNNTK